VTGAQAAGCSRACHEEPACSGGKKSYHWNVVLFTAKGSDEELQNLLWPDFSQGYIYREELGV
jgi:hypothetical protein